MIKNNNGSSGVYQVEEIKEMVRGLPFVCGRGQAGRREGRWKKR